MHHSLPHRVNWLHLAAPLLVTLVICMPEIAMAQASPFLTGASSLQTNILAWLTPVAIILVMVLGGMAMANRLAQVSNTYGHGEAQTIVENCSNILILRCSGSENGGTSLFASRLIGDREVLRRQVSRGKDRESGFSTRGARRSRSITDQHVTEPAVMASELEQLPDLCGYLKTASSAVWLKVAFAGG
jgi:Type IV secretion-system coupling protein DNA-binding domain